MNFRNRVKPRNEKRNSGLAMGITLLVMYAVSGVMLLALALFLYNFDLSEETVRIGVIVTYIVSGFFGGYLIGRWSRDNKYLWGLAAGGIYYVMLFLLSVVIRQGMGEAVVFDAVRMITTLVLCAVSSMAGGMVS